MNRSTSKPARPANVIRAAATSLALLAVTALTPACAPADPGGQQVASGTSSSSPTPQAPTPTPSNTPMPDDSSSPSDADIDRLIADMDSAAEITDRFWAEHWSDYFTGRYTAPDVVGLYNGSDTDVPICDGEPLLADNAFYCVPEHYVAWDAGLMVRSFDVGNSWTYLVIAHEWGHAVLAQLDPSLVYESEELQADCLAGATLYGAEDDGSITMGDGAEKELVDGLNQLADQTAWTDSDDHGDSFERIEAFNLGRRGGVNACLPE
jgi:predicted metalloprotease